MTDDADLRTRLDRLEELVERQRDRIDELEALHTGRASRTAVSRRTALKAGGLAGLLALGTGTAAGAPRGQVGTVDDPLRTLYAEELNGGVTENQAVTDLVGDGLAVDNGVLGAGGTNVGGGAGLFKESAGDAMTFRSLVAGTNVTLTDAVDTVTVDVPRPENVLVVAESGGEYTSIQDAVDDATAPALVWVAPGTYSEHVYLRDGVDVMGSGQNVTTIDGSIVHPSGSTTISHLSIEIDGPVLQLYHGNVTLRHVTARTGQYNVVRILSADVLIEDSTLVGAKTVVSGRGSTTIRRSVIETDPGSDAIDTAGETTVVHSKIVGGTTSGFESYSNYDETYSDWTP